MLKTLIDKLVDQSPMEREEAKRELIVLGPSIVCELLNVMRDFKRRSYKARQEVRPGEAVSESHLLSLAENAIIRIIASHSTKVIPALIEILKDTQLRRYAAQVLTNIGNSVVPQLVLCLSEPDINLKILTLETISSIGHDASEALPKLIELLDDPSIEIKREAIRALGFVGSVETVLSILAKYVHHSDAVVRCCALQGIGLFGPAALPVLSDVMSALEDVNTYEDAAMVIATMEEGAAPAIPHLIRAMRHKDWDRHRTIHDAFCWIGTESLWPLVNALEDPNEKIREAARYALKDLESYGQKRDVIARLMDRIKTSRSNEQRLALMALGAIGRGAKPALSIIQKFAVDGPVHLRSVALSAAQKIESADVDNA